LGLPIPYASAVLWNLDHNKIWITKTYSELTLLLEQDEVDEAEVQDALGWAMEEFWDADQPRRIDLVSLWVSISWFIEEQTEPCLLVPSANSEM
jgi:hypothetical protein